MKRTQPWVIILLICGIAIGRPASLDAQIPEEQRENYQKAIGRITRDYAQLVEYAARYIGSPDKLDHIKYLLGKLFYEQKSEIYHRYHNTTEFVAYSYGRYLDRLVQEPFDDISIAFTKIYTDSVFIRVAPLTTATGTKVYPDCSITVEQRFEAMGGASTAEDRWSQNMILDFRLEQDTQDDPDDWRIKIRQVKSATQRPIILKTDRDGDGVPDIDDRCPDLPGPAGNQGCPADATGDRDRDNIPDQEDKCPDQAGPAVTGGCPIVDTPPTADTPPFQPLRVGLRSAIPTVGDIAIKGKKSGAQWLWLTGVAASWGTGTYLYVQCSSKYPGCRVPRQPDREHSFEEYRDARLRRQNALILGGLGAAIWIADVVDNKLTLGSKNRMMRRSSMSFRPTLNYLLLDPVTGVVAPIYGVSIQF